MCELIETDRLVLRRITPMDAPRITECIADPRIYRMVASITPDQSLERTQEWIATHEAGAANDTNHIFALQKDLELVGVIGADRPGAGLAFDVGYWLAPTEWGSGLMTEAANAVKNWLKGRGERAFTSGHFADNPASGRVLKKIGFLPSGRGRVFSLGRGEASDHINMSYID